MHCSVHACRFAVEIKNEKKRDYLNDRETNQHFSYSSVDPIFQILSGSSIIVMPLHTQTLFPLRYENDLRHYTDAAISIYRRTKSRSWLTYNEFFMRVDNVLMRRAKKWVSIEENGCRRLRRLGSSSRQ